jgi:hypothetical protein
LLVELGWNGPFVLLGFSKMLLSFVNILILPVSINKTVSHSNVEKHKLLKNMSIIRKYGALENY